MAAPANHNQTNPKSGAARAQSPEAASEALSRPDLPTPPFRAVSLDIRKAALRPGLYLVATPIGNLRDISLRALDILASADIIYAEDTRKTGQLLAAYSIKAKLTAYHDHNAAKRIPGVINLIKAGQSVALVSDAGTPLVSDPGFKLGRAVAEAGLDIIPVPGASAALAALLTSALPSDQFHFSGFLPAKSTARKTALAALADISGTLIFFEAGSRVKAMLSDCQEVLGDRPMALARELTKLYEQTRRGTISDVLMGIAEDPPRGEIVIVIGGAAQNALWDETRLDAALKPLITKLGVKRAAAQIAEQSGHSKREVYARAQALKDAQS